jgi:serine/threonine protein kinase
MTNHPDANKHPSTQQLAAFDAGCLPGGDRPAVEAHVAGCARCCRVLETLPEDSLAALVRAYAGQDGGGAARPSVPAELVGHPRYRVLEVLGRGGMGAVYAAVHQRMDRVVALKVVHPHLAAAPGFVERFRREVRAAARLDHPHVVTVHDADQVGELHFLVMEHVRGATLEAVVGQEGPLPVEEACAYARQAALALQHAHEHGLVHRDVKPANLLRTRQGVVKLADFGLARMPGDGPGSQASLTVVGTPDYAAPEQARDPAQAGPRSDIYSLGCTLYFLLTGQPPFPGGTALQKLLAHQDRDAPPVRELRPEVPPATAALLKRMLAKDPAGRPATAQEVALALAPNPTAEPRRPPPRRRRWRTPAAVLAGLLLAASAVLLAVWPRPAEHPPAAPPRNDPPPAPPQPAAPSPRPADDNRMSAAELDRWKYGTRDVAFDWVRAHNRWEGKFELLASLQKDVNGWLDRKDGFCLLLGAGLLKSQKPTLVAARGGRVYTLELRPPRSVPSPKPGKTCTLQPFWPSGDGWRRKPTVRLSDLKIDNTKAMPYGERMRGTVSYRRTGSPGENLRLQLVYYHNGAMTRLTYFLPAGLPAEAGRFGFDFAELQARRSPPNKPQLVFVELASRQNKQTVVESNTLVEVLWPVAKKP